MYYWNTGSLASLIGNQFKAKIEHAFETWLQNHKESELIADVDEDIIVINSESNNNNNNNNNNNRKVTFSTTVTNKQETFTQWYPAHKFALEALVMFTAQNIFFKSSSKIQEFCSWATQRFQSYYDEKLGLSGGTGFRNEKVHLKNVRKQVFVDSALFVWDCPAGKMHNKHTPLRLAPVKKLKMLLDKVPNINSYLPTGSSSVDLNEPHGC
jgi:hypothetical protein